MGYAEDVYKLTMITHRKKQELIDSLAVPRAHKQRFTELFRRIDHVSNLLFESVNQCHFN